MKNTIFSVKNILLQEIALSMENNVKTLPVLLLTGCF